LVGFKCMTSYIVRVGLTVEECRQTIFSYLLHNYWLSEEGSFKLLHDNVHVMQREFNIQQMYVLPTQCIYVFCIYLIKNIDLN
jgi:hypothetical protein